MRPGITIVILLFCFLFLKTEAQYSVTPKINLPDLSVAFDVSQDGRVFTTGQWGNISVFDSNGVYLNSFYNLSDSTDTGSEGGVLGITMDNNFYTNHFVYVYYTHAYPAGSFVFLRVVRFTDSLNYGINPQVILNINWGQLGFFHCGGNIHFKNFSDTCLYVTIGDMFNNNNSQMLTNPFGKILRINKDGSIPVSNPFYDDGNPATGNDDRIWAYGLRNSFEFTFNLNDSLYATENGSSVFDEVNLISRGNNYGWPNCEGMCTNGYINPIKIFGSPLPAVTGVLFYSGNLFPQLHNHLLVADYNNGNITDLTLGNAPYYDTVVASSVILTIGTGYGLTTLKQMPDGSVYALERMNSVIYKITPIGVSIPESNSEGGLFCLNSLIINGNELNADFTVSEKLEVKFEVYDLNGKKVNGITKRATGRGEFTQKIILAENLSSAIYILTMSGFKENALLFSEQRKVFISQ